MTVEHLAIKKEDSTLWTPEQALQEALKEIREKSTTQDPFTRCLLFLAEDHVLYTPQIYASNLKLSEIVTMCEYAKHEHFMRQFEYNRNRDN